MHSSPSRYSTTLMDQPWGWFLESYFPGGGNGFFHFLEGVYETRGGKFDFKIRRGSPYLGGMKIPGGDQNPSANYVSSVFVCLSWVCVCVCSVSVCSLVCSLCVCVCISSVCSVCVCVCARVSSVCSVCVSSVCVVCVCVVCVNLL